jgi:putative OPT family oligopeptide transporter
MHEPSEAPPAGDVPPPEPYVAPGEKVAEMTPRAIVLGAFFGILFGAVTVYLALKVGLTVSASIPIAVLSIVIFRRLGRSTILENNLVQTIGSAGESIAAGVVFTLPALIFLNSPMPYHRVFLIALAGGVLGVLLMIPLRRALIVREHATLRYPEGTACANILIAGEKGGSLAGRVFAGLGIGALYKLLMSVAALWKEVPAIVSRRLYRGFSLSVEASPELLGVGYIIGFKNAATLVAGGLLSFTVLIPFVKFVGAGLGAPIFPGKVPIAQMDAWQIWGSYIRYIGAGAVAAGGVINLVRALPTITASFRDSVKALKASRGGATEEVRTERDLPVTLVFGGSAVLVIGLWLLLQLDVNPGKALPNAISALLIVLYGFFFVTVSSRVVGMIGSSNNPISGDTITTLMGTCLLFVLVGWTGHAYAAVALSIGAVVCIAAANAGATSQDLKTGFLVGATPRAQQIALIVGVIASVAVIGLTLRAMNSAYHTIEPAQAKAGFVVPSDARQADEVEHRGKSWRVVYLDNVEDKAGLADGKYLVGEDGQVAWRYVDGIGGRTLSAPQARLMSLVIGGILDQKLPWTLVLLGIFIGIVMELCGVHALPFAVGVYLPLSTTTPVFFGGLMKLVADKLAARRRPRGEAPAQKKEEEAGEGMLFSSGLIAGGALMGIAVAGLILASGKWQPLANGLEALRNDGVKLAAGADARITVDGQPAADGAVLPVRSRWIDGEPRPDGSTRKELAPMLAVNGAEKRFSGVRIEVEAGGEKDAVELEYDQEARARTLRFVAVPRWEAPLAVPSLGRGVGEGRVAAWLVEEGGAIGFGQPLVRIEVGEGRTVEVKAPQAGRLARHAVKVGDKVPVESEIGTLELAEPPISTAKAPPPVMRRRIVMETRPGSDLWGFACFLLLCAILVRAARRRRQHSSASSLS